MLIFVLQVKDEGLKPNQPTEEVPIEEGPKKVKTRAEIIEDLNEWSQDQQKALEAALLKYPKSGSSDRWEKIATCIESKTKVGSHSIMIVLFIRTKFVKKM